MTRPIVIGSLNRAKANEMAELLAGIAQPIRLLAEFPGITPVPETGDTFTENARLKAMGWARQIGAHDIEGVVADDSGLEVDAMGGRPGVFSARYISDDATDEERVQGILKELHNVPDAKRTARFRCHVAFATPDKVLIETEGVVEGRIAHAPAGKTGFGYDPIFIPNGWQLTFSQLGYEVKHKISHRANAIRLFRDRLMELSDGDFFGAGER